MNSQRLSVYLVWLVIIFSFLIILSFLPFIPEAVRYSIDILTSCLSFTACLIIYRFYHHLPQIKQTILNILSQWLAITFVIGQTHFMLVKSIVYLLPKIMIQNGFESYPALTCSLLDTGPIGTYIILCFFSIQV